ncbi:MAG: hypothetical protein LIO70_09230 [Clostridiales bacterium]|nr:hypothetical protein [Clostridiales bacterium]
MIDYMMDVYGHAFITHIPAKLQQALREKYKCEMKVKCLEHAVEYEGLENFSRNMGELSWARMELCAAVKQAEDLTARWEQGHKTNEGF